MSSSPGLSVSMPLPQHIKFPTVFLRAACLASLPMGLTACSSCLEEPRRTNEKFTAFSLREIVKAQNMYKAAYANGYAPNLGTLGGASALPGDCHAAQLIGSSLRRVKALRYVLEFRPGPVIAKPAPGCPPGVKSYCILARPA
jgi:hypothetical protein